LQEAKRRWQNSRETRGVIAKSCAVENLKFLKDARALPTAVIARESGRSSIPETPMTDREAAAYWMPRFRGA
jgi:hypothetical protein